MVGNCSCGTSWGAAGRRDLLRARDWGGATPTRTGGRRRVGIPAPLDASATRTSRVADTPSPRSLRLLATSQFSLPGRSRDPSRPRHPGRASRAGRRHAAVAVDPRAPAAGSAASTRARAGSTGPAWLPGAQQPVAPDGQARFWLRRGASDPQVNQVLGARPTPASRSGRLSRSAAFAPRGSSGCHRGSRFACLRGYATLARLDLTRHFVAFRTNSR